MKKALAIILAILMFVLGFVFGYITCNLTHSEEHSHIAEGEWLTDSKNHWKVCSCGEIMESSFHVGGEATYDSKAVCDICGMGYGEVLERPHSHEAEGEWISDGENHWKTCSCGEIMDKAPHTGGVATTEAKALCEICGIEYGAFSEPEVPVHTHKSEGKWKTDGKNHWKVCSCGEIMDKSSHKGGTATTDKKAECSVCGAEYGDYAKEDVPVHAHSYDGEWVTDGENHWKACSCGEVAEKSAHKGGAATTDKKAVCDICGAEYGDLAEPEELVHTHSATGDWKSDGNNHWKICSCGEVMTLFAHEGGEATTEARAVCEVCGGEYGELAEPEELVHIHSATGDWKSDGNNHWKVCSCGEIMHKATHSGGSATTDRKAICSVCSSEYGELVNDEDSGTDNIPSTDDDWDIGEIET